MAFGESKYAECALIDGATKSHASETQVCSETKVSNVCAVNTKAGTDQDAQQALICASKQGKT